MKTKPLLHLINLCAALLSMTASARAQGIVNFDTRVPGVVVAHVYAPDASNAYRSGNTASETPSGAQTYAGALLTGTGFSAYLYAANGAGQPEATLTLVPGSFTTFRTGATLGGTPAPVTLPVPGVPSQGAGTFQIRAWDNGGGLYQTYDVAVANNRAAGKSALFDVCCLGDGVLTFPADFANFRSFNIVGVLTPSERPPLAITRSKDNMSGNNMIVSWNASGPCHVQSATQLNGAATIWTDVPGLSPITIPITSTNKFFRLACP